MEKADIDEDDETTMARFLEGMNRDLAQVVDLQDYKNIDQMLHKARKLEVRLKNKPSGVRIGNSTPTWRSNPAFQSKTNFGMVSNFKKSTPSTSTGTTPKPSSNSSTNCTAARQIRCFKCQELGHIAFQCPNSRTMTLLEDGTVESDSEQEVKNREKMPVLLADEEKDYVFMKD